MFENEEKIFCSYQEALSKLYEREIWLLNEEKVSKVLPQNLRTKFDQEFRHLSESINFGIREQQNSFDLHISDDTFEKMRVDFKTDCPLLSDVMQTLFITDDDDSTGTRKQLSFVHAMALLINLKNKDLKNDVKLLFSILLLSYGVGQRLMNLLCRMKITYSWAVLSTFLDNFIEKKEQHVKDLANLDIPLVFLMDNINMYRGNKKYHRLFKLFGPKMWNFTGRGLLIPDISEIKLV